MGWDCAIVQQGEALASEGIPDCIVAISRPLLGVQFEAQNGAESLSTALPDFLVIGAMKSGTTTLYHDLRSHPQIFLPDKESNFLLHEDAEALYARALDGAQPGQVIGDISPDYTKLPDISGVVPRAQSLFEVPPKVIYIVREPVSRLLSHHYYMSTQRADVPGRMGEDLEACLDAFPSLLNYSRYAMQLRPWLEAFGRPAVRVVKFESYVKDRKKSVAEICDFLGVSAFAEGVQEAVVHNRGDERPVITPFWQRVQKSQFYREKLRPWVPLGARDRLRRLLFPKPKRKAAPPNMALIERIVEELREDVEELRVMLNDPEPIWDLDAVLENYRAQQLD